MVEIYYSWSCHVVWNLEFVFRGVVISNEVTDDFIGQLDMDIITRTIILVYHYPRIIYDNISNEDHLV